MKLPGVVPLRRDPQGQQAPVTGAAEDGDPTPVGARSDAAEVNARSGNRPSEIAVEDLDLDAARVGDLRHRGRLESRLPARLTAACGDRGRGRDEQKRYRKTAAGDAITVATHPVGCGRVRAPRKGPRAPGPRPPRSAPHGPWRRPERPRHASR